jgi:hypothetical protein
MWPIFKELPQNWLGVRMIINNSARKLVGMSCADLRNVKKNGAKRQETQR